MPPLWCTDPYLCWMYFPLSPWWRFFVWLYCRFAWCGRSSRLQWDWWQPRTEWTAWGWWEKRKKRWGHGEALFWFNSPFICIITSGTDGHFSGEPLAQCDSQRVECNLGLNYRNTPTQQHTHTQRRSHTNTPSVLIHPCVITTSDFIHSGFFLWFINDWRGWNSCPSLIFADNIILLCGFGLRLNDPEIFSHLALFSPTEEGMIHPSKSME